MSRLVACNLDNFHIQMLHWGQNSVSGSRPWLGENPGPESGFRLKGLFFADQAIYGVMGFHGVAHSVCPVDQFSLFRQG
jgi:hypothetical protein